jgi:hypothetical protein
MNELDVLKAKIQILIQLKRDLQIQYSKETGHLFKITGKLPDDETTKKAAWEISLALLDYEMPEDNEF